MKIVNNWEPTMIAVHHFRVYDPTNDGWHTPPAKSPQWRIEMVRGEIIPGTEEHVEEDRLDADGRYWPDHKDT